MMIKRDLAIRFVGNVIGCGVILIPLLITTVFNQNIIWALILWVLGGVFMYLYSIGLLKIRKYFDKVGISLENFVFKNSKEILFGLVELSYVLSNVFSTIALSIALLIISLNIYAPEKEFLSLIVDVKSISLFMIILIVAIIAISLTVSRILIEKNYILRESWLLIKAIGIFTLITIALSSILAHKNAIKTITFFSPSIFKSLSIFPLILWCYVGLEFLIFEKKKKYENIKEITILFLITILLYMFIYLGVALSLLGEQYISQIFLLHEFLKKVVNVKIGEIIIISIFLVQVLLTIIYNIESTLLYFKATEDIRNKKINPIILILALSIFIFSLLTISMKEPTLMKIFTKFVQLVVSTILMFYIVVSFSFESMIKKYKVKVSLGDLALIRILTVICMMLIIFMDKEVIATMLGVISLFLLYYMIY